MKRMLAVVLILCAAFRSVAGQVTHGPTPPGIPFDIAMKQARELLETGSNSGYYCTNANWIGVPKTPEGGVWAFTFWNDKKVNHRINVTISGSANFDDNPIYRWPYAIPSTLPLEDAVKLAQNSKIVKPPAYLHGASLTDVSYVQVQFHSPGVEEDKTLYVTFDGKVSADLPVAAAQSRVPEYAQLGLPLVSGSLPRYVIVEGNLLRVPGPERIPWEPGLTLDETLMGTGGFDGTPNVFITRGTKHVRIHFRPIMLNESPDPVVFPGDRVEMDQGTF